MDNNRQLRVCYFGTYRENYSRNQMMIAGLRLNGVQVMECHQSLWGGIEDRVRVVKGGWLKASFWWRVISTYGRLINSYFKSGDYDVLVVGYPGALDVFLARILTWIKRKPLVWDIFMSIYLISIERGLDQRNNLAVKLIHLMEGAALKLPDMLILDTSEYVRWFGQNYKVQSERFRLVPTGADDRIFKPLGSNSIPNNRSDGKFHILYYGTFIPNHGVMHILEAARLLQGESAIQFEFIGAGPELGNATQFAYDNKLSNVNFIDWMEKDQLTHRISQADINLGAFGTTPQSMMTIQNKIYEAMAMAKPLISGDSTALRQAFTHGENIYLCERASGSSLADAILVLWREPSLLKKISESGYQLYMEKYDLLHNGERLKNILEEVRA